jgi:hypothetical protein
LHEFFQCDTTIPSSAAAVTTYFYEFHIITASAVQAHFDELRGTAAATTTTTATAYSDEFPITGSTAQAHFDELRRTATTDEASASAAKARFDELRAAGAA